MTLVYDVVYHIFVFSPHKYDLLSHNVDIVCHYCENDVVVCLTEQSRNAGRVCGVIRAAEHAAINTLNLR